MLYICRDKLKILANYPESLDTIILQTDEASIGVDQIRDLQKQIVIKPTIQKTKIAVIVQAEKLTEEAQNALLKTLEEPPENTEIILIAPDTHLLLPTVLSRCQIITISTPPPEIDQKDFDNAIKILDFIEKNNIVNGFTWSKKIPDRKTAFLEIDKLIIASHRSKIFPAVKKLLRAKKYLSANTNVRLTLENLFL